MPESLVLTFAEIDFLLRAQPQQAAIVRESLRLDPDASSELLEAAGVASLIARGLCDVVDDEVRPGGELTVVAAALSRATTHVDVAGFGPDSTTAMHIYDSPMFRISIVNAAYGRFVFEPLIITESLAVPLRHIVERYASTSGETAFVIRSITDGNEISIAIARDADGAWTMSDTADNPDAGRTVTREAVDVRIEELFGGARVTVG